VNGDTFVAEKPRVWIAKLGGTQEHEVVFLQNFFDELRRRVPVGQ
jgi:hypothetical protein